MLDPKRLTEPCPTCGHAATPLFAMGDDSHGSLLTLHCRQCELQLVFAGPAETDPEARAAVLEMATQFLVDRFYVRSAAFQ